MKKVINLSLILLIIMLQLSQFTSFFRPVIRSYSNLAMIRRQTRTFSYLQIKIDHEEKMEELGSIFAKNAEIGDVLLLRGIIFHFILFY